VFSLVAWPIAAHADGLVGGTLSGATQTTTQTVTTTTNALSDALGGETSPLPTVKKVTTTTVSTVVSTGQTLGLLGGSSDPSTPSEAPSTGTSAHAASSPTTSGGTRSTSAMARSNRAVTSAGEASFVATGPYATLYQGFGAPPPPRYGGVSPDGLAVTGKSLLVPLGVLVVLLVVGLGSRTTERVRARVRLYGALRYRGRHRMPPGLRLRLRLSPAV
ncbi:MAG TPA: hypothetical protein VF972_11415, partial [Actinomycetota bacterium]